jgi:phosphoglycerate dehydrogenase-like enzyme
MTPDRDARVLIVDANPELYRARVAARVPGVETVACGSVEEIATALAAVRPNVVVAYSMPGMTAEHREALLGFDSVRWLHAPSAGIDKLPRWDVGRVTVTSSGGALAHCMVEYVLAAILSMNIGFLEYRKQQQARVWRMNDWWSVKGKTLLVVGLGHIGSRVAAKAKTFGLHVLGLRASGGAVPGVDEMIDASGLGDAVARADFIALHVPLTAATRHLFHAGIIARMKRSAWLINCARGAVVDQAALTEALAERRIGGAVLDVTDPEPLPAEHPLWGLDNVLLTPHMSDWVADYETHLADFFADNLRRWCAGEPLLNVCDPDRGY